MKNLYKQLSTPPRKISRETFLKQIGDYRPLWKIKTLSILSWLCVALTLTQCKKKNPTVPPPDPEITLSIEEANVSVAAPAGAKDITVISEGIAWTKPEKIENSWITNLEKTNENTLRVSYAANETGAARDTTLEATAGEKKETITFKQTNTNNPLISLAPPSGTTFDISAFRFPSMMSNVDVTVEAPEGWAVSDDVSGPGDANWLEATKSNNTTMHIALLENSTDVTRRGAITLSSGSSSRGARETQDAENVVISVAQTNTVNAHITVNPRVLTLADTEGTETITVEAPDGWTVTDDVDETGGDPTTNWLEVAKNTTNDGINVTILANTTNAKRTGNITLSAGTENIMIAVAQTNTASAHITVNLRSLTFTAAESTETITVEAPDGWTVTDDVDETGGDPTTNWLEVAKNTTNDGINVTILANTTNAKRTGNITLSVGTENVMIAVAQAGDSTPPRLTATNVSNPTTTTADITLTSDEAGTLYWVALNLSDDAPDKAEIVAGQDGNRNAIDNTAAGSNKRKGKSPITTINASSIVTITELVVNISYKVYFVVQDAAGNISDIETDNVITNVLAGGPISINYLEQLSAIRYDLDGNGMVDNMDDTEDGDSDGMLTQEEFNDLFFGLEGGIAAGNTYNGYQLARTLNFDDPNSYLDATTNKDLWSEEGTVDGSHVGWVPIGYFASASDNAPFIGTFDGQDFTIDSLFMNRFFVDRVQVNNANFGLFGYVGTGAVIHNLGLRKPRVTGNHNVGALAGSSRGTIRDCYVEEGTLNAYRYGGGLVGLLGEGAILTNCKSSGGAVTGNAWIGGLVGQNGYNANSGVIRGCYVNESVINSTTYTGGLLGRNIYGGMVNTCYVSGLTVHGGARVGGFVGSNNGSTVSACYVSGGSVSVLYRIVGGLAGENIDDGKISACYVSGSSIIGSLAGSLVGRYITGTIEACYTGGNNYAKLVGEGGPIGISNSYYQVSTVLIRSVVGISKTFAQIQSPTDYAGIYSAWNVDIDENPGGDSPWDFGAATEYPRLKNIDSNGDGSKDAADLAAQSTAHTYSAPTVAFDRSMYSAVEGRTVAVAVVVTGGVGDTFDIPIITSGTAGILVAPGTTHPATAPGNTGADYNTPPRQIRVYGDNSAIVQIMITADTPTESPSETIDLSFGSELGNVVGLKASGTTSTTIEISDPSTDLPDVDFEETTYSAAEGTVLTVTIEVDVVPGLGSRYVIPIVVDNTGPDATTATAGTDFILPDPAEVMISNLELSGTITVILPGDAANDDGRKLKLGFGPLSGMNLDEGSTANTVITIANTMPVSGNLIPVDNLERLDAIRYDLNGDGDPSGTFANKAAYVDIFPALAPGTYTGYQLTRTLNFDEDGSYSDPTTNKPKWSEEAGATEGWQPIGHWNSKNDYAFFVAKFQVGTSGSGERYTIDSLYINRPAENSVGLFGSIGTARVGISNLSLVKAKVTGNNNVGRLVGYAQASSIITSISNCRASGGAVTGNQWIGGLVGQSTGGTISGCAVSGGSVTSTAQTSSWMGGLVGRFSTGRIVNCSVSGTTITGDSSIGGLVGVIPNGSITNCTASNPNITSTGSWVGGLVGESGLESSSYNATIKGCTVSGGTVTAVGVVGGLAGLNAGGTISTCSVSGSIVVTGTGTWIGGLVGNNGGITEGGARFSGTITSSYVNNATVKGKSQVGGLVGNNQSKVSACYASSVTVEGNGTDATDGNIYFGGFAGVLGANDAEIFACYVKGGSVTGKLIVGGLVGVVDAITVNSVDKAGHIRACYVNGTTVSATGTGVTLIDNVAKFASSLVVANLGLIEYSYAGGADYDAFPAVLSNGPHKGSQGGSKTYTGTVTDTYYQIVSSGTEGTTAKTNATLIAPTDYTDSDDATTDIYADWDTNIDGKSGDDDPWSFGSITQLPVLNVDFDNSDGDDDITSAQQADIDNQR